MLKIYSCLKSQSMKGDDGNTIAKIDVKESAESKERVCGSCKYYNCDDIRNMYCRVNGKRRMPVDMKGCFLWALAAAVATTPKDS